MKQFLIFFSLILFSCQNKPSNDSNEITIDIQIDSLFLNETPDSIFDKKVSVWNMFNFLDLNKNVYNVKINYQGNDSLISFMGGFVEEDIFDKAKYQWNSDSSIIMTLFNSKNGVSKNIFLTGTMDGKSGRNGILK
ncbi:MAG: hypothetical protein CBE48_003225 [Flavobacteriales bacterium TMED288]|nr:hypothetical protein [Flavobacteriales bacterium]RPG53104.1 MAG: hypothetical protein CBE48_003225 [Flavobacteriales bacterium TMED288]|tara:strand:+ start:371 stop:778 length:408 start_codon:yes stop_codon:yes gene_type:complete